MQFVESNGDSRQFSSDYAKSLRDEKEPHGRYSFLVTVYDIQLPQAIIRRFEAKCRIDERSDLLLSAETRFLANNRALLTNASIIRTVAILS